MKSDYTNTSSEQSNMAGEPAVAYAARKYLRKPQKNSERVSPSKDEWFDIPENYQLALEAKRNMGRGGKRYSHEELEKLILADIHAIYSEHDAEDLSPLPEGKEAYTLEEFRDILISDLKETYGVNNEVHV